MNYILTHFYKYFIIFSVLFLFDIFFQKIFFICTKKRIIVSALNNYSYRIKEMDPRILSVFVCNNKCDSKMVLGFFLINDKFSFKIIY